MNISIYDDNNSISNIIIFLKEKLQQLIEYNSISNDDLKKICAINYWQLVNNQDERISNYLMSIFGEIAENTNIYNSQLKLETNPDKIFKGLLNQQFQRGLNK